MFSPGSLEKNSSTLAESHSPSRGKFPVGLNQLGEDSQQNNRIQSAVQRYNNSSTVGSFARAVNERSLQSPFRHSFLKNAQKYKNFESDKEEAQNNLKKSHNHYQGVGNFPIVHLKKNSVITRPIKRNVSNEFKIQLPELPFNRFLNHSPDICIDTKTSTRSVLDVLQDLSRKRIHTKDDTEATKRKCKGLGGDSPLDIEAPYKPLFVPKPKTSAVTLRDSTTQTQDLPPVELSPTKKNDTTLNNKKDDPKAELRRKLARQNNEIFASLSSSTLVYPLKRHSGKLTQDKGDGKQNEENAKRMKYFLEEKNDKKLQNGDVSSKDLLLTSNGDAHSSKTEKRHKSVDSKLSPNKDRLTTIFLEMKNTNPIVEILTSNQSISSTDSTEPPETLTADIRGEKKLSAENKNSETVLDGTSKNHSPSPPPGLKFDNKQNENITNFLNNNHCANKDISVTESNSFSFSSITTSGISISTGTVMNFGVSSSPTTKLPLASTVSSSLTQTPIFSTGLSQKGSVMDANSAAGGNSGVNNVQEAVKNDVGVVNSEANSPNQKLLFQPPTSGSGSNLIHGVGQQSTGTEMFKFGMGGVTASSSQVTQSEKDASLGTKDGEKNTLGPTASSTASSPTVSGFSSNISATLSTQSQFSLSTPTTTATTTLSLNQQTPPVFHFPDKSSTNSETAEKPVFQFGFNPTATNNSMPSSLFNTAVAAPKPEDKPAAEQKTDKNAQNSALNNANTSISGFPVSTLQNNLFSTSAPIFGQPADTTAQNVVPFKFGEKTETTKTSGDHQLPSAGSNFFDQKKPSLFAFGEKPSTTTSESPASQPNLFQRGKFSFGQKPANPSTTAAQTSTSTGLFGENPQPQSNIFQQAVVSQASTTAASIMTSGSPFGVTTQASDPLNKSQVPSFAPPTSTTAQTGIMNSTFSQNKLNAPTFGQTTTSNFSGEKNIFGTGTSQPAFGSGQPTSTFGDSNKQQPGLSSNFFSQPPTTQSSGFPSSTGFGTTGFGTNAFGQTPSVDGNIFGQNQNQNQSAPFGQSSTAQTFGSQTGFTFGATTTTTASFGFSMTAPATTTAVFSFGNTTKTTPASTSTFGFSGSAQPESASQSLFSFNNQPQANTFKFGSTPAKDAPAFGSTGSTSTSFSFNSTPSTSEAAKPATSVFSFGTPQTTSANPGFNFGASQTPVFSFGSSSGSSAGSSKFSFGAGPSSAGIFTPGATPSPSTVPLQGVFSIGSGSSQPRSRSSAARARRRP